MSRALSTGSALQGSGVVVSPKALVMDETARLCTTVYKNRLRALVLTGSVARDEGTFVTSAEGRTLLGDAEFFAVFHNGHPLPAAGDLRLVEQRIYDRLRSHGLTASVSVNAVHARYLRAIEPSIFGYELRTCGVVAFGDRDILQLIPRFEPRDIPLEDAWRLLANRLVEQLEGFDELAAGRPTLSAETHYRTVKLYLDMGTSLLVFAGSYAPTYRAREEALRQLRSAPRSGGMPFVLEPFVEDVVAATRWKLGTSAALPTAPRAFWERALDHAERLWRWELSRLTSLPAERPLPELLGAWIERQPLGARLRGWAHVARRQGVRGSFVRWPHWLRSLIVASPRYLTYAASVEALFTIPRSAGRTLSPNELEHLAALCQRLPSGGTARGAQSIQAHELAATCLRSYNDFITNTRA
jgi:hypothetical protein